MHVSCTLLTEQMVYLVSMALLVRRDTRVAQVDWVYLVSQGCQESEGCQDHLAQMVKMESLVLMELMEQTDFLVVEAQRLAGVCLP